MDENLKKAYELAAQMDREQADWPREQKADEIENFLKVIAMIESSGGKNFDHATIKSGIHKGHQAAGTYGLMPNTTYEVLNRLRQRGQMPEELIKLRTMEPKAVKAYIEQNPEIEEYLAKELAQHVLNKQQGDEEKAAYSWYQGHNLSPDKIEQKPYGEHDYVKKYQKYKQMLQEPDEEQEVYTNDQK